MPRTAFEHEGFRAWVTSPGFPEGVRATFAAGEVLFEMSPEAIETHSKVKDEVGAAIRTIVRDADLGETYADRVLLTHVGAGLSTEPDYCFASWATLESGRLQKVPRPSDADDYIELAGTPDLVLEVVSKHSANKDLRLLRKLYAEAGIPEYWVIDARKTKIHFQILRLEKGAYAAAAPPDAVQTSLVLRHQFALHRTKNRIGDWTYRLEVSKLPSRQRRQR